MTVIAATAAGLVIAGALPVETTTTAARHPRGVATTDPTTTTVPTSSTTAPRIPCRDLITPTDPLRLWIGGDSLAGSLGPALGKQAADTGIVAPVWDSHVSSGLSNPGFFNWPKRAASELTRWNPEIVVFIIGANDFASPPRTSTTSTIRSAVVTTATTATTVPTTPTTLAAGTPDSTSSSTVSGATALWRASYGALVEAMLRIFEADGRTVYWVSAPTLRDPQEDRGVQQVNDVARSVVATHPQAVFVDAYALFSDASGKFATSLDTGDGKDVRVRTADGVHLTEDGGKYIANAVFSRLDAQCALDAQSVPGKRQRVVQSPGSSTGGFGSGTGSGSGVTGTTIASTTTRAPVVSTTQPPAATTTEPPATTSPTTVPPPTTDTKPPNGKP